MQVYTSPLYPSLHDQTYGYRGMSQSPYPGQHKKNWWMDVASRCELEIPRVSFQGSPSGPRTQSSNYDGAAMNSNLVQKLRQTKLLNLTLDGAVSIVMETTHQRNWRTTSFSDYCLHWWAVAGCMRVRSTRCSPATAMKILTRHFPR